MTPRRKRLALTIVGWWLVAAGTLEITASAILMLTSGQVAKLTPLQILALPAMVALHPLDPAAAFDGYADHVRGLLYLLVLLGCIAFAWFTAARHGYLNPLEMGKSEDELPLSRQLTPRLRDLGIWAKRDAARGASDAWWRDKLQVKILSKFAPDKDLARAMVRRTNGMLVPYDGEQPSARVFLGTYRHLHLFRRKKYNVYARPEQHVVIFGPSGAGKGATQMNPSLLFWNGEPSEAPDGHGAGWPGAVITSTVKHDHVDAALEWRLSLSDQCFVYDPLQSYPEFKQFWCGWDPLTNVNNFSDANAVAQALMESESQQGGASSGNEDYFRAQALMVLAPMILSAAMAKSPFRTVYDWALRLEAEVSDPNVVAADGEVDPNSRTYAVMDKLYEYAEITGDETPLNQMQQVFSKDPREASGVWGSVRKTLQPYNDEKSVMSTDHSAMPMLDPKKFYSTPHATLFIIAPEVANESKRMRPVFAAFITWLIEEAQKLSRERNGKLPYPVLANLDEVKNVGAIPGLAHTLSLTRSIGFFVKHAWQDEAQIASAYGKDDAKTITSNSRTWVVLPGISDPDHLEALARLIGERPVKRRKLGAGKDRDQQRSTKAATASMIKEVKDNQILIITDNLPPFVIEATRYFQDPVMLARWKMGDARREHGITPDPEELRAWRAEPKIAAETITPDKAAPERPRRTPAQEWAETVPEVDDAAPGPKLPTLGGGLPPLGAPAATTPTTASLPSLGDLPSPLTAPTASPSRSDEWLASLRREADPVLESEGTPAAAPAALDLPAWMTGGPPAPDGQAADVGVRERPADAPTDLPAASGMPPAAPTASPAPLDLPSWMSAYDESAESVLSPPVPAAKPSPLVPAPDDALLDRLRAGTDGSEERANSDVRSAGLEVLFGTPAPAPEPASADDDSTRLGALFASPPLAATESVAGDLQALFAAPDMTTPETLESVPFVPAVPTACPDCGEMFAGEGLDQSQLDAIVARHRSGMHRTISRPQSGDDGQQAATGWTTP